MRIFSNLSPKRFFTSKKKKKSHVSRSSSSSSSSGQGGSDTPTTVLPETSRDTWSERPNPELLEASELGLVSIAELEELVSRLGAEPASRDDVAAVLAELGCDGVEARVNIDALVGPAGHVELRETFDFFDADGDGRVTEEELLGALTALGDGRCTLEECRRMIAAVDVNGDGFVCFADFSRMMGLQPNPTAENRSSPIDDTE